MAKILVRQYTLYQDYKISNEEKQGLSAWKMRKLKKEKLAKLRHHIRTGIPTTEIRYFVSLPTTDAHTRHPTDQEEPSTFAGMSVYQSISRTNCLCAQ